MEMKKFLLVLFSFWIFTVHSLAQTSNQGVTFTNNGDQKVWVYAYHEGCFESAIPALCYDSGLDPGKEVNYTPPDVIRNWDTFKEVFQFVGDALMIIAGVVITVVTAGAGAEVEAGAIAETVATTGAEAGLDAVEATEAIETAIETSEMSIEATSEVAEEFPEIVSAAEEGGDTAADMGSEALSQMEGQADELAEEGAGELEDLGDGEGEEAEEGEENEEDEEEEEDEDDCNSNSNKATKSISKAKNVISKAKTLYKNIKSKIPDPMKETFSQLRSQYQFVKGPAEQLYVKVISGDDDHPIDYESPEQPTDDMACELKALNKIVKDVSKLEEKGFKLIKDLEEKDRKNVSQLYSLIHMGLGLPVPIQTWSKNKEWAYILESSSGMYYAKAGSISLDGNNFELSWYPPGDPKHDLYWAKYEGAYYPSGTYWRGNIQEIPEPDYLQNSYTVDNNNLIDVKKVVRSDKAIMIALITKEEETWWKQVKIAYTSVDGTRKSVIAENEGDNHASWSDPIQLADISPYEPLHLSFWKAKVFGEHTRIGEDYITLQGLVDEKGWGTTIEFHWENDY